MSHKQTSLTGGDADVPDYCPQCDKELAHEGDLEQNDAIDCTELSTALRRHRRAHAAPGEPPSNDSPGDDDPYLAASYSTGRGASAPDDTVAVHGDPDEVVGGVFEVEINYTAMMRATVVAPNEHEAKTKAEDLRLAGGADYNDVVPEIMPQDQVHTTTRKVEDVHRDDTEQAERMAGWPW